LAVQLRADEVVLRQRELQAHDDGVNAAAEQQEEEAGQHEAGADGVVLDRLQLAEQPGWVRPQAVQLLVGGDVRGGRRWAARLARLGAVAHLGAASACWPRSQSSNSAGSCATALRFMVAWSRPQNSA